MSHCYLCLAPIPHKDALLCLDCFCRFQEEATWLHCTRCGQASCAGNCGQMASFRTVTSLYQYKEPLISLLLMAKQDNNSLAQKVFWESFATPVIKTLKDILSLTHYDTIVFSALRKERMTQGCWHPNIFYDDILKHLKAHCPDLLANTQILSPYFRKKKQKQAFIPSQKRTKIKGADLAFIPHTPRNEDWGTTLLLDDVLTTGHTASLHIELCAPHSQQPQVWDLLTLFRTPQVSVETKGAEGTAPSA